METPKAHGDLARRHYTHTKQVACFLVKFNLCHLWLFSFFTPSNLDTLFSTQFAPNPYPRRVAVAQSRAIGERGGDN